MVAQGLASVRIHGLDLKGPDASGEPGYLQGFAAGYAAVLKLVLGFVEEASRA